jgi:tetratricopeptide (TPR) repeat protein
MKKLRLIFEIVLIAIILIQAYLIFMLYQTVNNDFIPKVTNILEDFACTDKLSILYEFEEIDDFEALFIYGEKLLENGFDTDTFVLQSMAKAYYVKGNIPKAIELLNKAIDGNYLCNFVRPSKQKYIDIDKAMALYNLGELYEKIGDSEQANREFEKAFQLAKKGFGDKYNENVFLKLCNNASFKKLRQKKDT